MAEKFDFLSSLGVKQQRDWMDVGQWVFSKSSQCSKTLPALVLT